MNKTILFVAPTAYPLGGVAVWLNYILPGLYDKGWNVVFGMLSGRFHDAENYIKKYPFEHTIQIKNRIGTREGRVLEIQKAISKVNADIVVSVNVVDVLEAANRVKVKANRALKMVMTLHGLEADYFEDIKNMSQQLDAVVTTNLLTREMVNKYCQFDINSIYYAPYGVEVHSEIVKKRKIAGIKADKPIVILYVGRMDETQKRFTDLIGIVQQLENKKCVYELLIAGDGPSRKMVLEKLYKICDIGTINYLGKLNQQQLFEQGYQKADVLILTSEWETGPIVVWEAMACGVAVVSSKYVGCVTENALKNKHNCLLFGIGDVVEACENIISLRSQKQRNKLVQAGLELVNCRYSKQISIQKWHEVMQKILFDKQSKSAILLKNQWSKHGRLEKMFGHYCAHYIRRGLNKLAFTNSAGDEWPHSCAVVDEKLGIDFFKMQLMIEKDAKNET